MYKRVSGSSPAESLLRLAPPLPPGPKGLSLILSKLEAAVDPLGSLTKCARKYGDVIRLDKDTYLVNHPDYIEYVLSNTNDLFLYNIYKGIEVAATRFWGNGLPVSQGHFWIRQRRFIQSAYHRNLSAWGDVMTEYTLHMLETWREGGTRNLHQDLMRLSLKIAAKVICGLDQPQQLDEIEAALQATLRLLDNPPQLDVAIPTRDKKQFHQTMQRLDEIVYGLIQQHRANGKETIDILSSLLMARDENNEGMTDQEIRDEVVTLLRASHKNTPTALLWVWYLLARHPKVEANLVAELETILGGRLPHFADLPHLRYLDMVIKESMRLYPLYPIVGREAMRDYEIGGYGIPKGAQVMVSAWLMHHDPRYFDEPETFKPERWADNLEKRLPKFAYFPFGGGPRLCVVKAYAIMEMMLLVATISQRFRLSLTPGYRLKLFDAFSGLRPKDGLEVIPIQRSNFV